MRFPLRGHEPQISILIRVDNDAATDDFIVAEGDKDLTYGTTLKTEAERLRGNVTVEFEPVVVLKHLPEGSDLIIGFGLTRHYAGSVSLVDSAKELFRQPFLR